MGNNPRPPLRVFLDLAVGDLAQGEAEELGCRLAQEYLDTVKHQYGWPDTLAELDDEAREIFEEAFSADPSFSSRGAARFSPPSAVAKARLEIELRADACPRAAENFRALCTGGGKGKASGKPLHYKGLSMFRIVKGFMCQGGDVSKNDGSGGDSIYGGAFKDERGGLALKHDAAGVLSMANSGKDTQKSQFFITLGPAPTCDGKHTVVGKVVNDEGLALLKIIDDRAATEDGQPPKTAVTIVDCGQL